MRKIYVELFRLNVVILMIAYLITSWMVWDLNYIFNCIGLIPTNENIRFKVLMIILGTTLGNLVLIAFKEYFFEINNVDKIIKSINNLNEIKDKLLSVNDKLIDAKAKLIKAKASYEESITQNDK